MSLSPNIQNSTLKLEDAHLDLMTFFNAMEEVYFSVDVVNFKIIQISNGCEKLYGHTAAAFLADSQLWFELIHPDDEHLIDDEYLTLQRGEQVKEQYRIIRKDKTIRWVETKIIPTFDENGKLARVDGIAWDITDRKAAQEKEKESEAKYRHIVESAQEGIWTIDENNKTNFVNKKICDILGYTPAEMMGKGLYDFMDAEGKAYAIECMERRRKGAKETLTIRYIHKNGENVWASISANPIFDENDRYKGSLAMITDVTQRRADEEALKISEANLRTIFEHTDTAYILFSADMEIVSFNALAQTYSEKQNNKSLVANQSIKDYFTPERWLVIEQLIERVAAGEIINYELNLTSTDGNVGWYDVRWLNVKNSDNKNWGFILANKDITEAKLAALERERITADLIQHNKDLEQFNYIISHNLRAPVANIIGLEDLLKDPNLDDNSKQEIVERVSYSIRSIDTVIKDLNLILQTRELVNEKKERVYLNDLFDDIKASISNTNVCDDAQFKFFFDEVDSICSVRSYLYSIFHNLASNSVKYGRPGVAPLITISSHIINNKVEIRFKDNSKGIDLAKHGSQLFGLYKRFDTTTEGKGMGLFMVKTQAEALGGTINVKSELGQGTEFTIQFSL